jgi:hypothetical protein
LHGIGNNEYWAALNTEATTFGGGTGGREGGTGQGLWLPVRKVIVLMRKGVRAVGHLEDDHIKEGRQGAEAQQILHCWGGCIEDPPAEQREPCWRLGLRVGNARKEGKEVGGREGRAGGRKRNL